MQACAQPPRSAEMAQGGTGRMVSSSRILLKKLKPMVLRELVRLGPSSPEVA